MSVKGLMTIKEKTDAITALLEDCQLRGLHGSILIGIDGGEVCTVDLREHIKIRDLPKRSSRKKVVIATRKRAGNGDKDNPDDKS